MVPFPHKISEKDMCGAEHFYKYHSQEQPSELECGGKWYISVPKIDQTKRLKIISCSQCIHWKLPMKVSGPHTPMFFKKF